MYSKDFQLGYLLFIQFYIALIYYLSGMIWAYTIDAN